MRFRRSGVDPVKIWSPGGKPPTALPCAGARPRRPQLSRRRSRAPTTRPSPALVAEQTGVSVEHLRETPLAQLPAVVAGPPALLFVCGLPYTRMRDAGAPVEPLAAPVPEDEDGAFYRADLLVAPGAQETGARAVARRSRRLQRRRLALGLGHAAPRACASSASTPTATTGCRRAAIATRCARCCAARWRRRRSTRPCSRSSCAPTRRWPRCAASRGSATCPARPSRSSAATPDSPRRCARR